MFRDEILEKIFGREELSEIPLLYISKITHAIEEVLLEERKNDIPIFTEEGIISE